MKILVIVDMQNDFITGSLGSHEAQVALKNIKALLENEVDSDTYVLFTQDTHKSNYLDTKEGQKLPVKHCIFGEAGWEIHGDLVAAYYDNRSKFKKLGVKGYDTFITSTIEKPTFGSTALVDEIYNIVSDSHEKVEEIILCGVCTDICVVSNALMLKAAFYDSADIKVIADCCAGTTVENHEAALTVMRSCQIDII